MDRSLDEILAEKKPGSSSSSRGNPRRGGGRGRRDRDRSENFPRDGVRKSYREETRNLDKDWLHDKFEDNAPRRSNNRRRRDSPELPSEPQGAKLRVDNIHYELTEEDLDELFNRIGRVVKLELRYDRAGRSEGTAFVTYELPEDAREAVKQFDGANANGQPIRLTILPSGPGPARGGGGQRNPFDTAVMPPRPLEERITLPGGGSASRTRSVSPDRDIDEAAKRGIDRYVPGGTRSRSPANPPPRRREGRRPGARRDGGGRGGGNDSEGGGRGGGGGDGGRKGTGGNNLRPRKTAEELDAEMADYFSGGAGGGGGESASNTGGLAPAAAAAPGGHTDDIDMIE